MYVLPPRRWAVCVWNINVFPCHALVQLCFLASAEDLGRLQTFNQIGRQGHQPANPHPTRLPDVEKTHHPEIQPERRSAKPVGCQVS